MSSDHVYGLDEIAEENNRVPLWLTICWISLSIWAAYYTVIYWTDPQDTEKARVREASITYTNPYPESFKGEVAAAPVVEDKAPEVEDNSAKMLAEGKEVYEANCAGCHGIKGDGKGPVGAALNPPPRDFITHAYKYGVRDEDLYKVITSGVPGTGMPPWKGTISDEQIHAVLKYIRKFEK